jgi:prolyl-tRNA synthetase
MVVEQWSDERGLVWPATISPYQVIVTPVVSGDRLVTSASERLASLLAANGFPVLLDDRDLEAETKFSDADLVGIPWRITMGAGTREGRVEIVSRSTGRSEEVVLDDIIDRLGQLMEELPGGRVKSEV